MQVSKLQKMLENEEKVHQVLERALLPCANGTMLQIPSFLPKKVFTFFIIIIKLMSFDVYISEV